MLGSPQLLLSGRASAHSEKDGCVGHLKEQALDNRKICQKQFESRGFKNVGRVRVKNFRRACIDQNLNERRLTQLPI